MRKDRDYRQAILTAMDHEFRALFRLRVKGHPIVSWFVACRKCGVVLDGMTLGGFKCGGKS